MKQLVKQPFQTPLCGACCFCMIVGINLSDCLSKYDWYDFTHCLGMARALLDYNYLLGNFYVGKFKVDNFLHPEEWVTDIRSIFEHKALLTSESKRIPGSYHWSYWDGSQFFDPAENEIELVNIVEVWPLVRCEETSRDEATKILNKSGFITDSDELKRIVERGE